MLHGALRWCMRCNAMAVVVGCGGAWLQLWKTQGWAGSGGPAVKLMQNTRGKDALSFLSDLRSKRHLTQLMLQRAPSPNRAFTGEPLSQPLKSDRMSAPVVRVKLPSTCVSSVFWASCIRKPGQCPCFCGLLGLHHPLRVPQPSPGLDQIFRVGCLPKSASSSSLEASLCIIAYSCAQMQSLSTVIDLTLSSETQGEDQCISVCAGVI